MAVYYSIKPCKFCGGAFQPAYATSAYCSLHCICLCAVHVRGSDECWMWTKAINKTGYGSFVFQRTHYLAHRAMWEIAAGRIPDGLQVLHACDTPRCCNTAHLFLGTPKDNMADRDSKGRQVHPKGEDHWRSRLTRQSVIEIRASTDTGKSLGQKYGVSKQQISYIKGRKAWAHIE